MATLIASRRRQQAGDVTSANHNASADDMVLLGASGRLNP